MGFQVKRKAGQSRAGFPESPIRETSGATSGRVASVHFVAAVSPCFVGTVGGDGTTMEAHTGDCPVEAITCPPLPRRTGPHKAQQIYQNGVMEEQR